MTEQTQERHILAVLVDNEAGVLGRVVGLFSGRGYNIDSLTVSEVNKEKGLSRITITTFAEQKVVDHIVTLIERIVPVHKVHNLTADGAFVERTLALVKVKAIKDKRAEILHLADSFNAKEVDSTEKSFVFEISDNPSLVNEFLAAMKQYGILEFARTGITAIARGSEEF
ncbi:MAG: acetolactate synthase small subunit [Alphaproteobacteria bacterium CG11_big_fil_rev_8_21_14_0_20_39_49]|nr:MAG: acetolactate synthase small subunit [Alphaproteobacteria bacterium CG11_big_fil_rev_8_21_14_0_20_39_49]